ncbi:MAG: YkgJ family cysteine cluster protein [Myxococcales bacterium]
MFPELDALWIDAARKVGIPVVRGGDAYVHFDGETLHISTDEHLDADDSLAQLILHELCHALVQGPHNLKVPDWGLDNTTDADVVNEDAAVRLQAHLLGFYGLRDRLYPTTPVRTLFDSLGPDALAPASDESSRLARIAALRAAQPPWRDALHAALEETVRFFGLPRHPISGHPLVADARSCGGCVWRTAGGSCRQAAGSRRVAPDARGCTRWEPAPDCQHCGACCRSAYDSVEVGRRDPAVKAQPGYIEDRGSYLVLRRAGDRCAALGGPDGGPFGCVIYADRPKTCRDFENGGRHCIDARRKVGLTA